MKETKARVEKQALEELPALKLFDFYQSLASESVGRKGSSVMQLKLDANRQ